MLKKVEPSNRFISRHATPHDCAMRLVMEQRRICFLIPALLTHKCSCSFRVCKCVAPFESSSSANPALYFEDHIQLVAHIVAMQGFGRNMKVRNLHCISFSLLHQKGPLSVEEMHHQLKAIVSFTSFCLKRNKRPFLRVMIFPEPSRTAYHFQDVLKCFRNT